MKHLFIFVGINNKHNIMKLKNFALLLAVSSVTAIATSCGSKQTGMDMVDMIPVQMESDGHWSMIKPDGTIVYEDEFKNEPSMVVNGVFSVREGDGITLYRADDKPEEIKDCQDLKYAGVYVEGLIPIVKAESRITLINDKGETRFTLDPVGGKEIVSCAIAYDDGMLAVTDEDEKCGYFDTKGNCVIKPQYESAFKFAEGLALVGFKNEKDSTSYSLSYKVIDKKGETVFNLKKDYSPISYAFNFGYLLVKDANDRFVLLDKKGEPTKLSTKIKDISDFNAKYIIFDNGDSEYGVMDYEGETIIRAKYSRIQFINEDSFLATSDEDAYVLDSNGDEKLEINDFKNVINLGKFGLIGVDRNTYTLLNDEGKERNKDCEFHDISLDYSQCYTIKSDYFDVAAAINNIVSLVGNDGVGKYKFGTEPGKYFSNPSDYTYRTTVTLDDLSKKGYRYSLSVSANYDQYLADYSYGYGYYPSYVWNSNSRLNAFAVNINTEGEWGVKNSEKLTDAFKAKGYKVEKSTVNGSDRYMALLTNGKVKVVVGGVKGESEGGIVFFPASDTELTNSIVEMIDKQNRETSGEPEIEEIEVVTDTAAVAPAIDAEEVVVD